MMTERISASFEIDFFTKLLGLPGPGRISFKNLIRSYVNTLLNEYRDIILNVVK